MLYDLNSLDIFFYRIYLGIYDINMVNKVSRARYTQELENNLYEWDLSLPHGR